MFAIGWLPVEPAGAGDAVAPGETTVVDTEPPAFGLLALPVFMLPAPAGKLFAGWGALSDPLGAGGD